MDDVKTYSLYRYVSYEGEYVAASGTLEQIKEYMRGVAPRDYDDYSLYSNDAPSIEELMK